MNTFTVRLTEHQLQLIEHAIRVAISAGIIHNDDNPAGGGYDQGGPFCTPPK